MEILLFILPLLFFICWGSFLNVVAYRLAFDQPFFTMRSYCPKCKKKIAWYDNIPLLSQTWLKFRCRHCKKPISAMYPFIELLALVVLGLLFFMIVVPAGADVRFLMDNSTYVGNVYRTAYDNLLSQSLSERLFMFSSYFVFFTGLIVSTAMDMYALVVSQFFTLWLVPFGFLFAFLGTTKITLTESILGAAFGYAILWIIGFVFKKVTKKDGMGVGDMELLAMIGSFLGPFGVWISLMIGSVVGSVYGGLSIAIAKKSRMTRIPFGPFLSLGALIFFLFQDFLMKFLG